MFHPSLASAGLRLVGLAFITALIVACAPEDSGSLAESQPIIPELDQSTTKDGDVSLEAPPLIADEDPPESKLPESLSPISTALPLFGHKVNSSEYFDTEDTSTLQSPDMYSLGELVSGLTFTQALTYLDFLPRDFSAGQAGFELGVVVVILEENSLQQCFSLTSSGPSGILPKLCIRQQQIPFQERIGIKADVYQLETESLYIEYVRGGWLGIGTSADLVRTYRWDDSMVPVLRLRYIADGVFTEISTMGDGLGLEEMVSIAELPVIPLTTAAIASCPVSEPNATRAVFRNTSQLGYQNMDGTLFTEFWPEGRIIFRPGGPGHIHPDGSLEMKWPWFRTIEGDVVIGGRRLDAQAPPMPQVILRGIPDGYGETGFHPSSLIWPSEGCWEVTARVDETTLTFITLVILDKE